MRASSTSTGCRSMKLTHPSARDAAGRRTRANGGRCDSLTLRQYRSPRGEARLDARRAERSLFLARWVLVGRGEARVRGGEEVTQVGAPDLEVRRVRDPDQQVGRGRGAGGQGAQARLAQAGRPEVREGLLERRPGHVGQQRQGRAGPRGLRARAARRTARGRAAQAGGLAAQRGQQVLASLAAPGEHRERVGVERLGQHVADGGQVLAGDAPVRAIAAHRQVARRLGEQRRTAGGEDLLDLRGHLPGEQPGAEQRLAGQPRLHVPPLRGRQRPYRDRHQVRRRARPLHSRRDLSLSQRELEDLAPPRVGAPALQPAAHPVGVEHRDEPARPPLLADGAPLALGLDAALDGDRPGRLPLVPAAHADTASGDRVSTSRSAAEDSSVSQLSPVPTICSARAFFCSIMASIRSSRVPTQTNLRTWTSRRWPMRKARSVAWSSTAGFHQRSTWMTWFAAVRLSPVPPAFSDSRNSMGSAASWNLATIASRCFFAVPPCRKSTGQPIRADRYGWSMRPNSAYWVKHSALSPSAALPSQSSSSLASLPDRPGSREPSPSRCAGWLQTCFSFVMVASTRPRLVMSSDAPSILDSMSVTVAAYRLACS